MAGPGNGRIGRDVLPKLPDGQLDARGLGRTDTAGRRSGGPHQRRRQQAVPFPVDDGFFGVTHGKAARHDRIKQDVLQSAFRKRQHRTGMAGRKHAVLERVLHRPGELEQAQGVGDGGTAFAKPLGQFFLAVRQTLAQGLDGLCLFKRVQILALEVFDKRGGQGVLI